LNDNFHKTGTYPIAFVHIGGENSLKMKGVRFYTNRKLQTTFSNESVSGPERVVTI
jgi:CTP:phosphocholine cytidylyltransferase-like protein